MARAAALLSPGGAPMRRVSFGRFVAVFLRGFIVGHGEDLRWNSTAPQELHSTVWGDYCVLFFLCVARGWTLSKFVNRLAAISDPESRHHAVRSLVKARYGDALTLEKRDGVDGPHMRRT